MDQKITAVIIRKGGFKNEVTVKVGDGTFETLFHYYPDEINFTVQELMDLTTKEAYMLFRKKDTDYLRS